MFKKDFDVALHGEAIFLTITQLEVNLAVRSFVLARCRHLKFLLDVEAVAAIHLEIGCAPIRTDRGHIRERYSAEALDAWRPHLLVVKGLEVVQVSELARLRHSLTTGEPLVAVELQAVIHVVKESTVEEDGADGGASAAFSGVAVHNYDVFGVLCENDTVRRRRPSR